jgi:ATP-dependent Zn protease
MGAIDPLAELALLIRARHPLIVIETVEEDRARDFVMRACEKLDVLKFRWSITNGLQRTRPHNDNAMTDTENPRKALAHLFNSDQPGVYVFKDLLPHLTQPVDQRLLRETVERAERVQQTLILIEQSVSLQPALKKMAVNFEVALPNDREIRRELRDALRDGVRDHKVKVNLTPDELDELVASLRGLTAHEVRRAAWRAMLDDGQLDATDVATVQKAKQAMLRETGAIEFIDADITMDEVGGLVNLKQWLQRRESALSAKARDFGLEPPRGILLLGVQGAGKSMCARAVSAAWNLPLLRLDPGALYDRYVGESEKTLRRALATAEALAPVVLWIDEIEKGFASAASQSTDGGLSQRMFGSLLSWMQDRKEPIFVVATANDISALPPELLRKGRFDEIFFVDLPDASAREQIFSSHLKRRKRDPQKFDLSRLAAASDGFSGAEIEQAIVSGLYTAFAAEKELDDDVLEAELLATRPLSVTMAERIAALREWAAERTVPAG